MKFIAIDFLLFLSHFCYSHLFNKFIPYKVEEYKRVYEPVAQKATNSLQNFLSSLVKKNLHNKKSWCLVAEPKSESSLTRKIKLEIPPHTPGGILRDFENVKDLIRASLIFQDLDSLYETINKLKNEFGEPLKLADNFKKVRSSGSRDLNLVFQFKKDHFLVRNKTLHENKNLPQNYLLKFEVQLHLCDTFLVKQTGHLFYELSRLISNVNKQNPFIKVLSTAGVTLENFEKLIRDIYSNIKPIAPLDFLEWEKPFKVWNIDRNDEKKAKTLENSTTDFQKKINNGAFKKYETENKTKKFSCSMENYINNENCHFTKFDKFNEDSKNAIKLILKN